MWQWLVKKGRLLLYKFFNVESSNAVTAVVDEHLKASSV